MVPSVNDGLTRELASKFMGATSRAKNECNLVQHGAIRCNAGGSNSERDIGPEVVWRVWFLVPVGAGMAREHRRKLWSVLWRGIELLMPGRIAVLIGKILLVKTWFY